MTGKGPARDTGEKPLTHRLWRARRGQKWADRAGKTTRSTSIGADGLGDSARWLDAEVRGWAAGRAL